MCLTYDRGNGKRGCSFRKEEGGKYGRRRAVDKITIRMSEKATRNHTISNLHKIAQHM